MEKEGVLMEADEFVKKHYPEEWEKMCSRDLYHASEYAEWFLRGIAYAISRILRGHELRGER